MLKLLALSFRNLTRYKTRTIITVIAVIASVVISTIVDGYLRGIFNLSLYNLINYESSEVSIYKKGYFEKKDEYPHDITLDRKELESIYKTLDKQNLFYSPRYKTQVSILHYIDSEDVELEYNALLIGLNPDKDKNVFKVSSFVDSGEWVEKGKDGIVVGSKIAEKLSLSVGSFVTLQATGKEGFLETFEEEVIGIVNTENPEVNSSDGFMDLTVLDEYLLLDGSATELEVSDGKVAIAPKSFATKLSKLIGSDDIEVYYYEDVNDDLMAIMNGDKGSSYLILIFLFIIAASGISNTMIMSIMERQKETAMLRALGFDRKSINTLFLLEGGIVGLIGAVIGTILGVVILYPLSVHGIDISTLISSDLDIGYRVPLIIRAGIYWQSFVLIPFIAVVLSVLSALLPVIRSGRKEISELFRRG